MRKKVNDFTSTGTIPLNDDCTVYQAAAYMAAKRQDALLAVDSNGLLSGILTDRDLVYKIIANGSSDSTLISSVMTMNPCSVSVHDFALTALNKMTEGKFRHLPILDGNDGIGAVTVYGILDITKCLFEQIEILENYNSNLTVNIKSCSRNTLSALPVTEVIILSLNSSVTEAAIKMKNTGSTGILVSEKTRLAGICTSKDLILRVLAAKLDPNLTPISRLISINRLE
jgi:signal-transduction protein with cAMP-binding, CBS, and nucleotidyltransferase domain